MELTKTKQNGGALAPFWSDLLNTDRFFGGRWPFLEPAFTAPPANVIENGKAFKIEIAVPGFEKGDFRIDVEDNVLSISAEKEEETQEEKEHYTRKEFAYASFSRSFTLPNNCEDAKIKAEYAHGILTLEVPKKEAAGSQRKKTIKVQ